MELKLCEVLNKTYYEVFNYPGPEDKLLENYFDSTQDLPPEKEKHLDLVHFSIKGIKQAIKRITSIAPG